MRTFLLVAGTMLAYSFPSAGEARYQGNHRHYDRPRHESQFRYTPRYEQRVWSYERNGTSNPTEYQTRYGRGDLDKRILDRGPANPTRYCC